MTTTETPDRDAARTCEGCKFALFQDTGYSSWTVEGTDFFCLIGVHPDDGFDAWYKEDVRLNFAAQCPRFEAGESVHMDVDHDDEGDLTPEQKALYDTWAAKPE